MDLRENGAACIGSSGVCAGVELAAEPPARDGTHDAADDPPYSNYGGKDSSGQRQQPGVRADGLRFQHQRGL